MLENQMTLSHGPLQVRSLLIFLASRSYQDDKNQETTTAVGQTWVGGWSDNYVPKVLENYPLEKQPLARPCMRWEDSVVKNIEVLGDPTEMTKCLTGRSQWSFAITRRYCVARLGLRFFQRWVTRVWYEVLLDILGSPNHITE